MIEGQLKIQFTRHVGQKKSDARKLTLKIHSFFSNLQNSESVVQKNQFYSFLDKKVMRIFLYAGKIK